MTFFTVTVANAVFSLDFWIDLTVVSLDFWIKLTIVCLDFWINIVSLHWECVSWDRMKSDIGYIWWISVVTSKEMVADPPHSACRCWSLSRKNSLFFGSHEGARRGAILYSIAISCKLNGINLFEYISDVIEKTIEWQPNTPLEKYRDLLPDRWKKQ